MVPSVQPAKRVLGDATRRMQNQLPPSPNAAKKRKLNGTDAVNGTDTDHNGGGNGLGRTRAPVLVTSGPRASQAQSQQQHQSQFEEVLEKLTQDIAEARETNAERDQQWARPGLGNFDPSRDPLRFQQIEVEQGLIPGGKTAVKLFGVTEVSLYIYIYES